MYPRHGWLRRILHFSAWVLRQSFSEIPDALDGNTFATTVDRTPIWLAAGNPLGNHPWVNDPNTAFPSVVEVAVVGVGCAYRWSKQDTSLRENGGKMIVLEMDDPACGASGRNEGLVVMGRYFAMVRDTVWPYIKEVRSDLTPKQCRQMAEQFAGVYARSAYKNADLVAQTVEQEGYECDYSRTGWIQARGEELQDALSESVEAGKRFGFDDWTTISPGDALERGGMVIEAPAGFSRQAASFHPAKWVWSLLQTALQQTNVELFTRTRVSKIVDAGDNYELTTAAGTVLSRYVINATESYTGILHRQYRELIQPVQTQAAFAVGGPEGMRADIGLSGQQGFFGRHDSPRGNGVLFGSDQTPVSHRKAGNNKPSRFITKFLIGELKRYFRGSNSLHVTHETSGTPGFTADEFPVVGLMDGKRQYVIGGMCGSGTAVSFNGARHVVQKILDLEGPDDYPVEYFGVTRLLDPENHPWPSLHWERDA